MVGLGFTVGGATRFVSNRRTWLDTYSLPPTDQMGADGVGSVVSNGDPTEVSVTFVLEKLLSLDEASFEFELEALVIITWEDPKIFTRCTNAGVGGFSTIE